MNDKGHTALPLAGSSSSYGAVNQDTIKDARHHQASTTFHNTDEKGHEPQQGEQQKNGHQPQQQEEQQEKHDPQDSAHGSHSKGSRTGICGLVLIEIPVFLYSLSYNISLPLTQYYLTDRMYEELGVPNITDDCSGGAEDKDESDLSDEIQARVATYTMIISFLTYFPAVLPALFMGYLSDRFGRKAILYVVTLAMAIKMTNYALVFHYHWPIEYLYIGSVIEGLAGSFGSLTMTIYAVGADVTKEGGTRRGFRITAIEASQFIGNSAGKTVAGYWSTAMGYVPPMVFSIGLQVAALLFIIVFIPETFTKSHKTTRVTWSVLLRGVLIFLQRGKRYFFLTCLFTFFMGMFTFYANNVIVIIYLLSPPFCWIQDHVSAYLGVSLLASWLLICTIRSCLGNRVADDTFALIGALSGMVGFIFQGLAKTDLFAYLAAIASLLSNLTWPMLRALMSKMAGAEEQGSLFAGIAVIEMLATTMAAIVSPAIYTASLGHVHGLPFLCFAAVDVVIALCLIFLIVRRKICNTQNKAREEYCSVTEESP